MRVAVSKKSCVRAQSEHIEETIRIVIWFCRRSARDTATRNDTLANTFPPHPGGKLRFISHYLK